MMLLLLLAGLILATLGSVLVPVIASMVLAFIMQGLAERMQRYGLRHQFALWVTFSVFMGGLILGLLIVLPLAWQQTFNLLREFPRIVQTVQDALLLLPQKYPTLINEATLLELLGQIGDEVANQGQLLLSFSLSSLPNVLALLIYLILVPILVFFLLKDRDKLLAWCGALLPRNRPRMQAISQEMNLQLANYVRGKFIEILIVGTVSYVAFVLLGLKYAVLLSLTVGLSVLIPYIGAAVVTVPIAVVAYFQWGFTSEFAWLMIAYMVIQGLDGNVLVPLLFSEAVNLHPVAIILAVLVFGGLWGFWGVFFAIPLATLVKALLTAWPRRPAIADLEPPNQDQTSATPE